MGFLNNLLGGKRVGVTAETVEKTKMFLEPQILALSREELFVEITFKSIAYIVSVAENLGKTPIGSNEFQHLLSSLFDDEHQLEMIEMRASEINQAHSLYTSVISEMKAQANNDIVAGSGNFLIEHSKKVTKEIEDMFKTPEPRGG